MPRTTTLLGGTLSATSTSSTPPSRGCMLCCSSRLRVSLLCWLGPAPHVQTPATSGLWHLMGDAQQGRGSSACLVWHIMRGRPEAFFCILNGLPGRYIIWPGQKNLSGRR